MLDLEYDAPKGPSQTLVVTLQVLVALVTVALAAALPVLWILSIEIASGAPEFAWLRWPYLVISVALLVCAQVICLFLMKLLSRVQNRVIFDTRALSWVNVILGAGVGVTVLLLLALVPVIAVTKGPPGLTLLIMVGTCVAAGFTLLMVVMRQLLMQATAMRAELSEVI